MNMINHIAFIMDGNRRWARQNNLQLHTAYKTGGGKIEEIADYLITKNIKYATFYAFSTENWNRSESELNTIFNIMREYIDKIKILNTKKNIGVRFIGDIDNLPEDIKDSAHDVNARYCVEPKITIIIALNYGSRNEIMRAINKIIQDGTHIISENQINEYLDTKSIPDPDILIRTGGNRRLSNFLMIQAAYSEIYFIQDLWPDITKDEINKILDDFYFNVSKNHGA